MTTDPQIVRALGDLEGTVRGMAEQWKSQEVSATAGRRALYERFEGLSVQMGTMSGNLDGVTQDVAEMKNDIADKVMPTIEAYKLAAARQSGVMWATKLFYSAIVAFAGAVGFAVREMLIYFGGGKH